MKSDFEQGGPLQRLASRRLVVACLVLVMALAGRAQVYTLLNLK
jgi:hypothetical protein